MLSCSGDSYSSVLERVADGTVPDPTTDLPLGVPFPGSTWTEGEKPNWVGHLLDTWPFKRPLLIHDFAMGGDTVRDMEAAVNGPYHELVNSRCKCNEHWKPENSLFVFWIGINDLAYISGEKSIKERLVELFSCVQTAYNTGARAFLFIDIPPINRAPLIVKDEISSRKVVLGCNLWNEKLNEMAQQFSKEHVDSSCFQYSSFRLLTNILDDPTEYGFDEEDPQKFGDPAFTTAMHPASPQASRSLRSYSTSSTSSSPRPSTITARPSFPWVPHPRPSSLGPHYSQSPVPGLSSSSWERDSSSIGGAWAMRQGVSQTAAVVGGSTNMDDRTMRQWSFNAFEWQVRDVVGLKEYLDHWNLEQASSVAHANQGRLTDDKVNNSVPELLRESPIIGDGKFKLEACASCAPNRSDTSQDPTGPSDARLSVFVTSLMLDYAPHTDTELCTTMMAAIKVRGDFAGERGARADWVWEFWDQEWTFRKESEFWECSLPSLSTLLEHPRIAATNSFVLCIQIHTPVGPQIPQQPSIYYVPKDLLEGIEASLDNANTGDVQFVCLERLDPSSSPPGSSTPNSRRSSSDSSAHPLQSSSKLVARKRVIYAHSDILRSRGGGEYFATMFSSGSCFSENAGFSEKTTAPGERKIHTVVVEEADFNTIYWMLKWVYGNWLLFQADDDPRIVFKAMGQGQSVKWLPSSYAPGPSQGPPSSTRQAGEWDWQTLYRIDAPSEAGSLGQSLRSLVLDDPNPESGHAQTPSQGSSTARAEAEVSPQLSPRVSTVPVPRAPARTASGAGVRRSGNKSSASGPPARSTATAGPTSSPGPYRASSSGFTAAPPHTPRFSHTHPHSHPHPHTHTPRPQPDPHVHPTPAPSPASALAVYQTAHRYELPGLAQLALNHILETITPQRAFALLLATRVWDELHALIEDYVVNTWDEVSRSDEFETCCREIAAGEWGMEGGMTLTELFRRLQSPSSTRYGNKT
ncbi:unnamed protein product [Rhizoctonia solani]|uniref:BTB domain-containing protein n=1 Tax=Rhizoctonia solani TaxID=456999 RepID=A0A8H3B8E1_9AGAM|nr:unnamed protein product [Rhizoctonia solani]